MSDEGFVEVTGEDRCGGTILNKREVTRGIGPGLMSLRVHSITLHIERYRKNKL